LVVASEAEAILELWLLVPWVPVALAAVAVSVVALRVSTEDAAVEVLEEDSAAVEEDSEAATGEVIEAAMAHLVMPRLALDSTAETAAAMVTGTVATEGVVTEAPVGMILVAAVAHLTTDTAAAIVTVADTAENARTDVPAATWNPSEVDEKVGIANNGTETTTDPVMTMVAESVAMTAAMRILESFVVINGVMLHDLVWWVADLLSVINPDHFSTKGRVSTPLSPTLGYWIFPIILYASVR
jgi:hypothetical protein